MMPGQRKQCLFKAAQAQPVVGFAADDDIGLAHLADSGGSAELPGDFEFKNQSFKELADGLEAFTCGPQEGVSHSRQPGAPGEGTGDVPTPAQAPGGD